MKETYEYHLLENHRQRAKQAAYERKIEELNMKAKLFAQIKSFSFMHMSCLALNTNISNEDFLSLSKNITENEVRLTEKLLS